MPPTFDKSRNIQKDLWDLQNSNELLDLDSKVQVTSGGEKTKVVVSTQHHKDIDMEALHNEVSKIVSKYEEFERIQGIGEKYKKKIEND